jgi:hypothetical protein
VVEAFKAAVAGITELNLELHLEVFRNKAIVAQRRS